MTEYGNQDSSNDKNVILYNHDIWKNEVQSPVNLVYNDSNSSFPALGYETPQAVSTA